VLTRLLETVQKLVWGGNGIDLLATAEQATVVHHVLALLAAGAVTGMGQIVLRRLSSGNGIDTTAAIWFHAGRLPALRTLGSAVLSVIIVGMGVSLGREGAPKQVGAVFGNLLADGTRLSDEQRRLLVACGSGAGMAAAYGVPLGGALFSLEVMRGVLALRYVMPALVASAVATAVAWILLPDAPTYPIPAYASSAPAVVWALLAGPLAGLFSVGYVRLITLAERNKPVNRRRIFIPLAGLGLLGLISAPFPQILGNGKDASQLAFASQLPIRLLLALVVLKPFATILCIRCGAPGGFFQAFAAGGGNARRGAGLRVVVDLAGSSGWSLCCAWGGGGAGGDYAGSDLDGGSDDGADGAGPVVHPSAAACGGDGDSGCAVD
jgi:H+/Cl- antiporter ClcA